MQIYSMFDNTNDRVTSRRTLTASLQLIAYTNCAVNPIIYCLLNDRFKASLNNLAAKFKSCGVERVSDRRPPRLGANLIAGHSGILAYILRTTSRSRPTVTEALPATTPRLLVDERTANVNCLINTETNRPGVHGVAQLGSMDVEQQ